MRLSLELTRADLASLLGSFLPLQVRLAGESERYLVIDAARSFELVPGVGLRLETSGQVHWEALGIALPLSVRSMTALARLDVPAGETRLRFAIAIERGDVVGVPALLDQTVVQKANDALARASLAWDFGKTLGRPLPLPPSLTPVSALVLRPTGGDVTVTAESVMLTIDIDGRMARDRAG
jgi:hypothetical protein